MTDLASPPDPIRLRHRHLEKIAMAALNVGCILMESGAKAEVVRNGIEMVVSGLGAETIAVRIGYASISLTVRGGGDNTISRLLQVGHHGVNLQLNNAARALAVRASQGGMEPETIVEEVKTLRKITPKHHWIIVALATGLACASFGQLLGTDATAFLPIWFAGFIGQTIRHFMVLNKQNLFAMVAIVAFASSAIGGLLAQLFGSSTPEMAMFSSVLLLVPGVPSMNAQTDIMEGSPTLGSARALTVMMILVFLTVGVALSRSILMRFGANDALLSYGLLHHIIFGGIAAAGFGILFNFSWRTVGWTAIGGGIALAVRTLGMDAQWGLAMSSTLAAAAVTVYVRLLYLLPVYVPTGGSMLAIAGCIPMIPGSSASHGLVGLMTFATQHNNYDVLLLGSSFASLLSVVFTIGGIAAAITLINEIIKRPSFPTQ
ncbi:threonine/serine ThrE exporter family protein [Cohaesibacter haloalkalitolerans]|uniref:threonine/serine ThrE exporter family protein n=1 Tax=Cohaesibacter haloalkalitolerans TaxID=1162980 RepID=UPI000E64FB29|nr:threonine/serine exporter family protein [Cohaesibacter haloalkalitolerans]